MSSKSSFKTENLRAALAVALLLKEKQLNTVQRCLQMEDHQMLKNLTVLKQKFLILKQGVFVRKVINVCRAVLLYLSDIFIIVTVLPL